MVKAVRPPKDECILSFPSIMATDSCSIWNVLSSKKLMGTVKGCGPHFAMPHYVYFECIEKPRSRPSQIELELQKSLKKELDEGKHFSVHSLSVDDLRGLAERKVHHKVDRGEVATMALAQKLVSGMLTDDYDARMAGENVLGSARLRSTPHLVGWLVYGGRLTDGDVSQIVADNDAARNARGQIGPFIKTCYMRAMELRLRDKV